MGENYVTMEKIYLKKKQKKIIKSIKKSWKTKKNCEKMKINYEKTI